MRLTPGAAAMLDSELRVNEFMISYCDMLMKDLPDDRLAEQPAPGVNHPAWILGHLAFAADRGRVLLGISKVLPEDWAPRFGPKSSVSPNRADYPPKDALLTLVHGGYERLRQQVRAADPARLAEPNPNPFSKDVLLTVQDALAHLLTSHLGVHLGQLSMWRRMIGQPPLF